MALAVQERAILDGLKNYIGEGQPNAEYAQLGFAVNNFARNALLLEKYYSNGQFSTTTLNLTGVRYERALSSGLDLGKGQLQASITQLRDKEIEPANEVASLEYANVQREGDVERQVRRPQQLLGGVRVQPGAGLPRRLPAGGPAVELTRSAGPCRMASLVGPSVLLARLRLVAGASLATRAPN